MIIHDLDHLETLSSRSQGDKFCLLKGANGMGFELPIIKWDPSNFVIAYSLPTPIGTGFDSFFSGIVSGSTAAVMKVSSNVFVRAIFNGPTVSG